MHQDHDIVEWLVREKKVTRKQATVLRSSAGDSESLELYLVQKKIIDKAGILKIKAAINQMPSIDIDPEQVDLEVVRRIPQSLARKFAAVPVAIRDSHLVVALANPSDPFAQYYIGMRANLEVEPRVAYLGDVLALQQRAYPPQGPEVVGRPALRPQLDLPSPMSEAAVAGESRRVQLPGDGPAPAPRVEPPRPEVPPSDPAPAPARASTPAAPEVARRDEARPMSLSDVYTLTECARDIARSNSLEDAVNRMLTAARRLTAADSAAFLLCEPDRRYISYSAALGAFEDATQFAVPFDESTMPGWCVLRNETVSVESLRHDGRFLTNAEQAAGLPVGGTSCVPVVWQQEVLGVLVAGNHARNVPDPAPLEILAAPLGAAVRTWQMQSSIHNISMEAVEVLLEMDEITHPGAKQHGALVAGLATSMARFLSLSATDIEHLCFAALLHDIGLTNQKNREDPQHPQSGGLLLQKLQILQRIIPVVRYHHERFDGTGYPYGLKGEAVPLAARVLAVAEAYCEQGLHKVERTDPALQEFLESFGTAFDPALKAAFIRAVNVPEE